MNAGFTWRLGGQMYNTTLLDKVENADVHYNVDRRVFTGRWSEPGQVARFKSITDDSETKPTSRFVEDYNLLTFSSLNVYYDFRECRFMEKSFLQRMKATFYMNDIATISSVKTERGTSYPFARSFSFSLFRCTSEITGARRRTFFYGRRFQRPVDRSVQEIGFDLFVWAGNDLRVSRSLDTKL